MTKSALEACLRRCAIQIDGLLYLYVCAVSRSTPEVYTVYPAAEALSDNRDNDVR